MLINFDLLVEKYKLNIDGVIHVGGHYGLEHDTYKLHEIKNILYFEPVYKNFEKLKENVKCAILVNKALGNDTCEIEMYIESTNDGQSCSILKPKLHLIQFPHIKFNEKIKVSMMKLDDFNLNNIKYNFINMDVQGYELNVLKGAIKTLNNIDYIMSEVNRGELYENCARVEQLDMFLCNFGFERVETEWYDNSNWGDAFYIKNQNL